MSPVVLALDLLLVSLLVLTLVLGFRLNGRLKSLKQSHAGFEKAVAELNQAAARAEAGLAALRETSAEAHDALLARIDTARALTTRLERATFQAEKAAEAVLRAQAELPSLAASRAEAASKAQMPSGDLSGLPPAIASAPMPSSLATIAALVADTSRAETRQPPPSQSPARPAASSLGPARRGRSAFDEDLFEDIETTAVPTPFGADPSRSGADPSRSGAAMRLSGGRNRPKDDRR